MKKIVCIALAAALLLAFAGCSAKKPAESTTATTAAKAITRATTEATTRQTAKAAAPATPAVPAINSYRIFIDNAQQASWTVVEWTAVEGADGYELQYGTRADADRQLQEQWEDNTETIEGGSASEHKVSLTYASGFNIDMVRIRSFMQSEGETVFSNWSEPFYMDVENKVMV